MDAFAGIWNINPSEIKDAEEFFDMVSPMGIDKNQLLKPHQMKITVDGDKMTVNTLVEGKPAGMEMTAEIGKAETRNAGGMTIQLSSRFDAATGKLHSHHKVEDILEVDMIRWVEGNTLCNDVTANGKTWSLRLSKAS